jgi:glyoxylase I family protein
MTALSGVRWAHVALNCRDQAATEEFYRKWFGFSRVRTVEEGDVRVVFLRQSAACLELFPAEPAATALAPPQAHGDGPATAGTIRHIAFQVDDLNDFLARAGDQLPVSLGPLGFDKFIPGWKTVWVTDPDGVVVEISQGYTDQIPATGSEHDA